MAIDDENIDAALSSVDEENVFGYDLDNDGKIDKVVYVERDAEGNKVGVYADNDNDGKVDEYEKVSYNKETVKDKDGNVTGTADITYNENGKGIERC